MSRLYQKKYLKMHKDGNIKCKMHEVGTLRLADFHQ